MLAHLRLLPIEYRASEPSVRHDSILFTIDLRLNSTEMVTTQYTFVAFIVAARFEGSPPRDSFPTQTEEIKSPKPIMAPVPNHPNLRLLRTDICGIGTGERILRGTVTSVSEFPWMAMIGYKIGESDYVDFKCGGTVIASRYVLTAAHCVTGLESHLRLFSVRLGQHDLDKEEDSDANELQDFLIEEVHFHDEFTTTKKGRDIALIRLDRDIDFGRDDVKPICLPVGNAARQEFHMGLVTGWGLNEFLMRTKTLMKARLSLIPQEECAKTYKKYFYRAKILNSQFCAGSMEGVDSCRGDSGGPFQLPSDANGRPQYFQYGVISFGHPQCGTEGVPSVFTNVVYFMDWILDTMKD